MSAKTSLHTVQCPRCKELWKLAITERAYRTRSRGFPQMYHPACACEQARDNQKKIEPTQEESHEH